MKKKIKIVESFSQNAEVTIKKEKLSKKLTAVHKMNFTNYFLD